VFHEPDVTTKTPRPRPYAGDWSRVGKSGRSAERCVRLVVDVHHERAGRQMSSMSLLSADPIGRYQAVS